MRAKQMMRVGLGVALMGLVVAAGPTFGQTRKTRTKGTTGAGTTGTGTTGTKTKRGATTPATPATPTPTTPNAAAITAAQSDLASANKALTDLVAKLTRDYQATPDYQAALKAVQDASQAYEAAKAPVLAALPETNPKYKLAKARLVAAQKKYDKLKAEQGEDIDITQAGQVVFDLTNALGPMEEEALENDITTSAAKTKLDDALAVVASLMGKFNASLQQNADWIAASQAVKDAQTKLASAK